MGRTRAAVLDGAARAVEKYGSRRTTMGDIAALAGIAKATVYNHFRTKGDVYRAALDAAVLDLGHECAALARTNLAEALVFAADRVGGHPALRRVATEEPAVLAAFLTPGDGGTWRSVRSAAADLLNAAGRDAGAGSVDTVVRWVSSHAAAPGSGHTVAVGAEVLAAGLPRRPTPE